MLKTKKIKHSSAGFTLIELLVVISIISLISSITLVTFANARRNASDSRKVADMEAINNAIGLFYSQNNLMPKNYNGGNCTDTPWACSGFHPLGALGGNTFVDPGSLNSITPYNTYLACDNNLPGYDPSSDANTYIHNPAAYDASMQELVNAGILASIPHSPADSTYCYYDTGHGIGVGAVILTELTNTTPSSTPIATNCAALTGLCSTPADPTNFYCLCQKY